MLYRHIIHMHAGTYRRHNKDERYSSLEKYTSHFIEKGCVWEGVGDRTELQHIDPHSSGHNHVPFPFSWAAQPGAWGPSPPGTCSSIQHLISNWSDPQLPDFLSSPGLYNCFMPTQSLPITGQRNMQPPPSLELHIWSSSSGNNCHAVHRSPSSGASVCDCTVGF